LFPPSTNGWIPKTLTCSAYENSNIDQVLKVVASFENHTRLNGSFESNRKIQDAFWLKESLEEMILNGFYSNEMLTQKLTSIQQQVESGEESSFSAAEKLYLIYLDNLAK